VPYRDKEIKECTFKPQLYESKRYKTAQTSINTRRTSIDGSCSTKPKNSDRMPKQNEQITFEITIAKGVVKTIKYDVSSDPEEVAMRFCQENKLPVGIREKLKAEIARNLEVYTEAQQIK
jgi:hypothetical protein